MSLQDAQLVLQALSSAALVLGAIFAVVNLRESRKTQYVANFTRLIELQMRLRQMRVEDPTLARVYAHDAEHLPSEREVREYFLNLMQLSVFEVVWFAHQLGQVPDDYYQSWVENMRAIEGEASFKKVLDSPSMKLFHEEFLRVLAQREPARTASTGRS